MESYRGPMSVWEQPEVLNALKDIQEHNEQEERVVNLHQNIVSNLAEYGIETIDSCAGLKAPQKIKRKIIRYGIAPLRDIYSIELVLHEEHIETATEIIYELYPTPTEFPGGVPRLRHGRGEFSDPEYDALHMNIIFDQNKIAEIKIFTPEQLEIERRTRPAFDERRSAALDENNILEE